MWLVLRSIKSVLMFINNIRLFSVKLPFICPHEAGWTPFQTLSISETVQMPGIEPAISLLVVKHADHSANEAFPAGM